MSNDTKTKPRANVAATAGGVGDARGARASGVNREAALRVAAGLTEAERDLVAGIVDWQVDGLEDDYEPLG